MLSIEACTRCCSSRSVSTCLGSAPDQRSLLDHRIALGQEFVPRRLRLGGHLLGRGACLGKDRRGLLLRRGNHLVRRTLGGQERLPDRLRVVLAT